MRLRALMREQRPAQGEEGPAGAGGGARASARTWSKMGSSTLSNTRAQNGGVNAAPWNLSVSNSTCARALGRHRIMVGEVPLPYHSWARLNALARPARRPHGCHARAAHAQRRRAVPLGLQGCARRTHRSTVQSCMYMLHHYYTY